MSMATQRTRSDRLAEINVTPMADIMIVLLIIFMIAAPLFTSSPVPLPKAQHGRERTPTLNVIINRTGAATVGTTPVANLETLAAVAAERLASAPSSTIVLLQVDHETPYAIVARAIELMRDAGAEEVSLAVDPRPGSTRPS